jgi:nucleotide-binding universal stress UspA family protein
VWHGTDAPSTASADDERMSSAPTASGSSPPLPVFDRILCAVNGSRGSAEAVRQAIALAASGGSIRFVAVTDVRGVGANRIASLGEHSAQQALAAARALGRDKGIQIETELVHADDIAETLLTREGHDLMVVGSHGATRFAGITLGNVATVLAHRTTGPLLIARPGPAHDGFPKRIAIAVDGSPTSEALVRIGGRLAAAHCSYAHLVHVMADEHGSRERHALALLSTDLFELTGVEPLVDAPSGPVADEIVGLAERTDANLVVVGRRGLSGLRAIGSVSERVAHRAPCSVLIMPAFEPPT